MSFLQDSSIADLTRGGQLVLHFLRMMGQVIRKFGTAALLCTVLLASAGVLIATKPYERYLAARYAQAYVEVKVFRNADKSTQLKRPDGVPASTTQGALARSPTMARHAVRMRRIAVASLAYSAAAMAAIFVVMLIWVWRAGSRQREEQHLRGAKLVDQNTLRRYLRRRRRASDITVAGVPLVRGSETLHLLLTGATGTGKSTLMYELLKRIRERGDRCICYSRSGDFIEWFYREKSDYVLNPFDARCPAWSLWEECPERYHHDMIAAALVPETSGKADPFWSVSARILVSSLTQTMAIRGERSIPRLMELLSQVSLDVLYDYVRGTEAAAVIDPSSEKTAASVRSTAVAYARSLRYLPFGGAPFHIREWVHDESKSGWIFLNANAEQIDSVRPVLSAWLEVFTSSLLSLRPNRSRRVWLVLDELPSLHKIPSLMEFLAEGRKYGGCGVISFQDIALLRERYGQNGATALTNECATWALMRQNDPETAKWSANAFGQVEVMESNQGVSYGANDMRDGVSLSQTRKVRPLLLDSEILNLKELEGYIRLPGDLPVAKFATTWQSPKVIAPAFVSVPIISLGDAVECAAPARSPAKEMAPARPTRARVEVTPRPPGLFDEGPPSGSDRPAA